MQKAFPFHDVITYAMRDIGCSALKDSSFVESGRNTVMVYSDGMMAYMPAVRFETK